MTISFKMMNTGKVLKSLERKNSKFRRISKLNYILAADEFLQEMREKYYEGQKGEMGVNQITTDLWKHWFADTIDTGNNIVSTMENKMNYSLAHEYGTDKHQKRTDVTGEMMGGVGEFLFVNAVKKSLKEAF